MERKKILCMTDSPKLHTGFAGVGREVMTHLQRTGKYEIKCIGWFHQETNEEVIYPIILTERDEKGRITQEDKYGHKSFNKIVDEFKPDLVWTLGDHWMVDHVARVHNRKTFKWVMYCPIDGHPSPSKWKTTFDNADVLVAYGKYGMDVMKHRSPTANIRYIYHGVDSEAFHPISEEDKSVVKKSVIGVELDKTIIGIVARNQPRKAFDKLFEAYFYILNGLYMRCEDCKKITVFPFDVIKKEAFRVKTCKHCAGNNLKQGEKRDDVRLYIHGAVQDCGWDLTDLQHDFNLSGKILVNPSLRIGVGVSEFTLNGIYNAFDIFTLPTRGEGFGLPVLEAMSAGVPVVTTDYSAHPEWCEGAGILIPPATLEAEPLTNIRRAIIDVDLYVTGLMRLIEDKDLRKKLGNIGREKALTMDWSIICSQWEKLIDEIIYPDGVEGLVTDAKQMKYNLEEC